LKPDTADPTAIVLAAGKGARYEGLKQLAKVKDKPLLQYVLDSIQKINWKFEPLLILGCCADRILNQIDSKGFRTVKNDKWKDGMSASLKKGVEETPDTSSGFMFFLGDMPLVNSKVIEKVLKKAAEGASIVAPSFRGNRGFPVFLHRRWKDKLLDEVSGDKGAREIIKRNREDLTPVPTDDQGVVLDINRKSDLFRINSYLVEEGKEIGL